MIASKNMCNMLPRLSCVATLDAHTLATE